MTFRVTTSNIEPDIVVLHFSGTMTTARPVRFPATRGTVPPLGTWAVQVCAVRSGRPPFF
jgi:hypothetical protein